MAMSSPSIYRDLHDLYHSDKVAKAGPGLDDRPEHPSVQINSSSPWYRLNDLLSESGLQ